MDATPRSPYSWRSDNAKTHLAWFLHEGVRYEVTGNQIEHYIVDNGSIVLIVSSIDSDNAYMPQIAMSENKRMSLITESYKALRESRK